MRKFLAILLAVAMITALVTVGSPVSAEESYRVTYFTEEITDIDTIVLLATTQKTAAASAFSVATPDAANSSESAEELTFTQLLEVREYADGTKEEKYVQMVLSAEEPIAEQWYQPSVSQVHSNYTFTLRFYYSLRMMETNSLIEFRPLQVISIIHKHATGKNISRIELSYYSKLGNRPINTNVYTTYSNSQISGTQTFTMHCDQVYRVVGLGNDTLDWFAEAYYFFTDGSYLFQTNTAYIPSNFRP